MGFSAFNVSNNMVKFTGNNTPGSKFGSKPRPGGSFTPDTREAFFLLRANLDNQFESAAITKYKQLMQNRLNSLVESMRTAYTNLLNVSLGQQIGENAGTATRSDIKVDGIGASLIQGTNMFKDYGSTPTAGTWGNGVTGGATVTAITPDLLQNDNIAGYGRNGAGMSTLDFQYRSLTANPQARSAGDVAGTLVVSMRSEEVPPNVPTAGGAMGAIAGLLSGAFGGPPAPTKFNQKVAQYTADFKTGGFWSTVNYLNNFAPKQIKYSYAVSYTANSSEAGDRDYLDNGRLLDGDDVPTPDTISGQPTSSTGTRVKWDSFEPTDGYKTEKSGTTSNYANVYNRTLAFIDSVDGNGDMMWQSADQAAATKSVMTAGVPLSSGTRMYNFTDGFWNSFSGSNIDDRLGITNESAYHLYEATNKGIKLTNEVATGTNPGTSGSRPSGVTSTLLFNHYDVEVRTVDYNNGGRGTTGQGNVVVNAGMLRSKSIDASNQYQWVDADDNAGTGVGGKEAISVSPGSANIAKSFTGEFVQSLHKIHSFNGVDVVGNEVSQASPALGNVALGNYEGYLRSLRMSQGLTDYTPPKGIEVDAAESAPTDWYQAESLAADPALATINAAGVWFPFVAETNLYWGPSTSPLAAPNGTRNQTVELRNSFQLKKDELFDLDPYASWGVDDNGVRYPTYTRRPFNITVNLGAGVSNGRLFVNGRYVDVPAGNDITSPFNVDISRYLKEGDNTIAFEGVSDQRSNEGLRITAGAGNDAIAQAAIQSRMITGYDTASEIRFNTQMTRPNAARVESRWQARLVPSTTSQGYSYIDVGSSASSIRLAGNPSFNSALLVVGNPVYIYNPTDGTTQSSTITATGVPFTIAPPLAAAPTVGSLVSLTPFLANSSDPNYTGSSSKAGNTMIELLIKNFNKKQYQDIFKMGLVSNLNKMLIQGSASVPSGTSLQGAISMYFDPKTQAIVMNQDRLIGKS